MMGNFLACGITYIFTTEVDKTEELICSMLLKSIAIHSVSASQFHATDLWMACLHQLCVQLPNNLQKTPSQ